MKVTRADAGTLSKAQRTPQGGLRAPAYLTRVGVFDYYKSDGSLFRELRPEDEVFRDDSLASLRDAPVTVDHPGMVTSSNWRDHAVGHVGETITKADDRFVAADLVIQDSDTVAKVEARELVELSCGYSCELDMTPGEYNGEKYDAVQRNIVYNHVAIGGRNWGRAGSDVKVRLDSSLNIAPYTEGVMTDENTNAPTVNVDIQVDAAEIERVRGENDALKARVTELETALAAEREPARLDAKLNERDALRTSARKIVGDAFKADGKTDRDIMVEAITAANSALKCDGKSDEYVAAMFATVSAYASNSPVAELNTAVVEATRSDAAEEPSVAEKAHQNFLTRSQNAWKTTPNGQR